MSNVDVYQVLADTLHITRKAAKEMVLHQVTGGGSNIVKAEWEVVDAPTHFKHRIVLKDVAGTVVKTSHWSTYRAIARIDYGGMMYRAATEYHDGDLPVNCVFTVNAPPECPSCVQGRVPTADGGSEPCRACGGTRHQEFHGVIMRGSDGDITPIPEDPGSVLGVARGRGEHGQPGHRCSGFCKHYDKSPAEREEAALGRAADAMYDLLHPEQRDTPNDRPPVKFTESYADTPAGRQERGAALFEQPGEKYPPECEHGTKWCTGKGEKHACDPRTAR